MIGAIVGDILGSAYEFYPVSSDDFEMLTPKSKFTDDTVCTLALADAHLSGEDFVDALHRLCPQYPAAGYGSSFATWLENGSIKAYGSYGNGAGMRVSSAAYVGQNLEEVLEDFDLRMQQN